VIFLLFFFLKSIAFSLPHQNNSLQQLQLDSFQNHYSKQQANRLVLYFNSLYPNNKLKLYENFKVDDWERVLTYQHKEALALKHKTLATKLARALAIIYYRQTKFERAIPYLEYVTENTGFLERDQFKNSLERLEFSYSAIGNYKEAILIRKKRVNEGFSNSFWELYEAVGMYAEAIIEFKSFERFDLNNDFQKIRYHNKLGSLFLKNNQIDSARSHFKKMENKADYIINVKEYKGKNEYTEYVKEYFKYLAVSQQGECLLADKKYKKAIPVLQKVIPYCNAIKEVDQKLLKWMSMTKCYNALQKPNEALLYLSKIKKLLKNKRILNLELNWYKQFAIANKLKKNLNQYNKSMINFFDLKDSISFQNQQNSSLLLLAKYDITQKKELLLNEQAKTKFLERDAINKKRIIALSILALVALIVIVFLIFKNYKQQKKAKEELEITNNELVKYADKEAAASARSEFLLQEMHHRIKNNLQMISSLLSLQKNTLSDIESQRVLNDSKTRIKTMSLVHQQLYQNSKLDSIVSLKPYLEEIGANILSGYTMSSKFNININTPFSVSIETAMNIGLIVNEALTNAIKYNAKASVNISIVLSHSKANYLLTISDNGRGFSKTIIKGFGLQLINILAKQLKGSVKTFSDIDKGVKHEIEIAKELIV
jgi:two-component sensor histidine kinase